MNPTVLRALVHRLPGRRIVILGDVILDEYLWGTVRRISPEAPVPILEMKKRTYIPGGAANSAANVVALGGQVALLGVVGNDYHANQMRQALADRGIGDAGLVVDPDRTTTTKSRIVAHHQQMVRVDCELTTPLSPHLETRLLAVAEEQLAQADACIISDYAKGVVTPSVCQHFLGLARRAGAAVIVDPKGTDYTKYRGATLIKPNLLEAERCTKMEVTNEATLVEIGQRLLNELAGTSLLITRGGDGMSLFRPGVAPRHIPAIQRDVFDVTGAGDTVASVLSLGLAAGAPLEQAAALANLAASIVVGKVGTAVATVEELLALLSDHEAASRERPKGDSEFRSIAA